MSVEVKPGYKQTEVGEAPEDWEARPLFQAIKPANGQVSPRNEPYRSMVLVAPDHIEEATGRLLSKETAQEQGAISGKYIFKRGDIVYSKIRPYLRKAILPDFEGLCSADMYPLTPANDVSSAFVFFVLLGHHFSSFAGAVSARSGIPKINREELAQYVIALPPLPEQRAIAAALSDVDALIGALDQLIAKKRDLKQAAMQQLLTGQKRLPGFCGEWEVRKFDELFTFGGGFSASRDQLSSKGHCYLHYGDIHLSLKTFVDVRAEYQDIPKLNIPLTRVSHGSLLADGDVVFVDASEDDEGTSKHIVIVNKDNAPFISGLHTIAAKSKSNSLDHQFRRFCFQTSNIKRQFLFFAVGTKVSGISKTNIAKLTIPIPSLSEQAAIASVLSGMDAELAALEQRRNKTRALKQGMMQELLTGRIRLV